MANDDILAYILDQENRIKENAACVELAKEFRAGGLDHLTPLWHQDVSEIDLGLQPDQIVADFMNAGITLIQNVELSRLFASFDPDRARAVSTMRIAGRADFTYIKFCRVLQHWKNRQELIPPMIFFNPLNARNDPQDGKHRLRVSLHLKVTHIPIIVPTLQLQLVQALL